MAEMGFNDRLRVNQPLLDIKKSDRPATIMASKLTPAQIAQYHQDGYLIYPGFFNDEQARKLYDVAVSDDVLTSHAVDFGDQTGKRTKLTLWYTPGDDPYGMLTRSESLVDSVADLVGHESPVCHFHSKLMQKEPKVGGAWEWHQDYGYWYQNGFLFPERLISVMVALTEANAENGCLQVIRGSHALGRVQHGFAGDQQGADMAYVEAALANDEMEHVYVTLQPGDALFFHSNLLHRSEANLSDKPRWSFISCYNVASNKPFRPETPASSYTPVSVVPDSAILASIEAGAQLAVAESEFWSIDKDAAHQRN
jgi:phytanoyl-CoA hydroxylase